MADLARAGFTSSALATSARRLGAARDALDFAERNFTGTLGLDFHSDIYASLDRPAFAAGPPFLRARIMTKLIARFGGATPVPQLSEIEDLVIRLHGEDDGEDDVSATLGGAVISQGARVVKVWREAGRISPEPMELLPGGAWRLWDERFWVRCAAAEEPVAVRALGADGRAQIIKVLEAPRTSLPAGAVAALPAFLWAAG